MMRSISSLGSLVLWSRVCRFSSSQDGQILFSISLTFVLLCLVKVPEFVFNVRPIRPSNLPALGLPGMLTANLALPRLDILADSCPSRSSRSSITSSYPVPESFRPHRNYRNCLVRCKQCFEFSIFFRRSDVMRRKPYSYLSGEQGMLSHSEPNDNEHSRLTSWSYNFHNSRFLLFERLVFLHMWTSKLVPSLSLNTRKRQ